ncbi:MAG: DtxR family transcriptional regulator [candidate division KSB1 bacterium]|nr:DtxR family transcriptional regulator [candidate division KSB1 bacterium]MDZ7365241.1 DtxR family transcriptional regulator [candidate division KSB1 bacterium]MDZ7403108.1 DtxR family transcriptional regulator [candidate division KSB1 bacterium]
MALIAICFWPQRGLIWQWQKSRRNSQKILLEDALKHLYHQEYKGQSGTIESLSGALGISRDHAAKLLARLETLEMIKSAADGFSLTPVGKSYALRIIRVHRLWELYFADETGLAETRWHAEAERREHLTTPEEADALATQMGNPIHDPHGDPIPTSNGELPPRQGKPLTDLATGELARIVHIEDEPEVLYAQLVAQGLYPGMQILVTEKSAERIKLLADGEDAVLAPVVAANVTVVPMPKAQKMSGPHETLGTLKVGETGVVLGISKACRGMQRRRLMDLGVIPGTVITAELESASGNPTAYNIRGALIALRKDQANLVHIRRHLNNNT